MFSGSCKPTDDDYQKALLFVRRNEVADALHWLLLNSGEYSDVTFSTENLQQYTPGLPLVLVEYFAKDTNRTAEGVSVHDDLKEDGVEDGQCVFTVHGIVGEDLNQLSTDRLKAIAVKHLDDGGKFMCTSHAANPESIWNNPHLYGKMFPWLFPYGMGCVGSTKLGSSVLSEEAHKKFLLLYHDKRFQMDLSFPFVAFSHEQIKQGTTQSFLLANSNKIDDISARLLTVDKNELQTLASNMANGKFVKPTTDSERQCFALLRDLEQGSKKTKGSISSKKEMQREIWSLTTHIGGPSWYFTLTPCDYKHPLCIYYADTNDVFDVPLRTSTERRLALSNNPAAGARFFHFMVTLFLDVVIGDVVDNVGILGPTAAYYCTVEQQGRLTLHLHGIAFTKEKLSPLEIKAKLMDTASDFQQKLLAYLESVCVDKQYSTSTNPASSEDVPEINGKRLEFLSGHPLCKTHFVGRSRDWKKTVPNFTGGPLPRRDKEDREFYCCTMLVFFQPWRTGEELKLPGQLWHDAFTEYKFSERHDLYMKNMNLRYECLDARDNYRAQLLAGNQTVLPPSISSSDLLFTQSAAETIGDMPDSDETDDFPDAIVLYDPETAMVKGRKWLARERGMQVMQDILTECGWMSALTTQTSKADIEMVPKDVPQRPAQSWSIAVQIMCQELLLKQRDEYGRPNDDGKKTSTARYKPNVVEICDKYFFEKHEIDYGSIRFLCNQYAMTTV
ncbi:hypothetical protein D9757_013899 [Collybiopsis confluens]|uniref:Helitron helicase-like domain-containing protein n=1 Tax=Collybiopsis confluens TaxID=2823264 RepID=A0A8H5CMR9_9AGAR|nr:hypothetical protein D9757_013899 [Collybiopsis confluens]